MSQSELCRQRWYAAAGRMQQQGGRQALRCRPPRRSVCRAAARASDRSSSPMPGRSSCRALQTCMAITYEPRVRAVPSCHVDVDQLRTLTKMGLGSNQARGTRCSSWLSQLCRCRPMNAALLVAKLRSNSSNALIAVVRGHVARRLPVGGQRTGCVGHTGEDRGLVGGALGAQGSHTCGKQEVRHGRKGRAGE